MSWRPEVLVGARWETNGLRFPTERQAIAYARDLMLRWVLVDAVRAVPDDNPADWSWTDNHLEPLPATVASHNRGDDR